MSRIHAAITGVNGYLPADILTNEDLARMVNTTDAWITERTGIKERRILRGKGLGTSHMAAEAVRGLLKKTKTKPEDVDLLICATVTPDFMFPSTANLVCDMLSMRQIGSFDILAACSGFLYALNVASQFIETGRVRKAVVIGGDKLSSIIDYTDRTTCVLFGDAACAVMLEGRSNGTGILDVALHADGSGLAHIHQKAGGSRNPPSAETVAGRQHYVYLDGRVVFRDAVLRMTEVASEIMERNALSVSDIDWFVPHQANLRIVESTGARLGIPPERVLINLQKYGNTSAASIPLALWDYERSLKKGDRLLLAAFGVGYTWAGAYLVWAYDGAETAAVKRQAEEVAEPAE
jgi:3-oxoacyl-[acyl-carrier-protein] synthase III